MNDRSGYVYLIKSDTGHYKIGRTKTADARMHTFEVKLPVEVEFIHLIDCYDMFKLERELHAMFQARRINGEWFVLDRTDVAYLKRFASQDMFDLMEPRIVPSEPEPDWSMPRWTDSVRVYALMVLGAILMMIAVGGTLTPYFAATMIGCVVLMSTALRNRVKEGR